MYIRYLYLENVFFITWLIRGSSGSGSGSGSGLMPGSSGSSPSVCPRQETATKCCYDFFTSYRHLHWPSCQTFEYLDKCFSFTHCDLVDLAVLCSNEYRKVHNRYIPKEAILAVYENLRLQCTRFCQRYQKIDADCISQYKSSQRLEREQDRVLNMEIQSLRRQLQSGTSWWPMGDLCKNMLTNLRRLHAHRNGICDTSAVYCLCRKMEQELPQTCLFKCDQFRYYENVSFPQNSSCNAHKNLRVTLFVIVLLVGFLCA